MDWSNINYVMFRMKLAKESFVIGGPMAAALCEPLTVSHSSDHLAHLYVSSTDFETLKDYSAPGVNVSQFKDCIHVRHGSARINFYRGLPAAWINADGYQVMDPLPLANRLRIDDMPSIAAALQSEPFEIRRKNWDMTEEEIAFEELCKKHDWHWRFSDDPTVRGNGAAASRVLEARCAEIGGHAIDLYKLYSVR